MSLRSVPYVTDTSVSTSPQFLSIVRAYAGHLSDYHTIALLEGEYLVGRYEVEGLDSYEIIQVISVNGKNYSVMGLGDSFLN